MVTWWLSRSSQRTNGRHQERKSWTKIVRSFRRTPLIVVALRDDDAEDDEGAGVGDQETKDQKKESMDVDEVTGKKPREVQPTGRVVGVVKRNWRA